MKILDAMKRYRERDPGTRDLIEELYERYGRDTGLGGASRRFHFWRKKTAWVSVVGGAKLLKRAIDIAGSLWLLAVLAPLFALVALAIKLTDRGPVLYWQTRVGKWGQEEPCSRPLRS